MPVIVMPKIEKTAVSKYGCLSAETIAFSAHIGIEKHVHFKFIDCHTQQDSGMEDKRKTVIDMTYFAWNVVENLIILLEALRKL